MTNPASKFNLAFARPYTVNIHIAGSREGARIALNEFCLEHSHICVSVIDEDFIYPGCLESGIRVSLIHYPRYPMENPSEELWDLAMEICEFLLDKLHQRSAMVESDQTNACWIHRKQDDGGNWHIYPR